MTRFLSQIWNTISQLGTYEGMEFAFRRQVILTNRISLLGASLAAIIAIMFLSLVNNGLGVFMAGSTALILLALPVINHRGKYLLSRLAISLLPPLLIVTTSLVNKRLAPDEVEIYQFFMPKFLLLLPLVIPLILFDLSERRRMAFSVTFNLIVLLAFDPLHRVFEVDPLQLGVISNPQYYSNTVVMGVIGLGIIGSIWFLQQINQNYEGTILDLLKDQKNTSDELRVKERTLTEAFNHLQSAEEDMRRNTHLLEEEIRQRKEKEKELVEERKRAEGAAKAKEDFLSMMSHEIRTPMNAVIGMTHLLIEDSPKPEQEENLRILQLSAENLLSLVNDILDFNKIEAGKVILEEVEFDLEELLLNLKSSFQNQAQQKRLSLRTFLDPGIPRKLIGDPVRISQVLYNLVSNALKFTTKGNVTVSVKSMDEDEESVTLKYSVADSGIGIAPDKLEAIFESFVQENTGTTRKFGGSGLGLSIVKRLLELMDSKIAVKSQQDRGSDFSFVLNLPISTLSYGPSQPKPVDSDEDLEGLRVLVVEDNAVNQMVIRKFLRKWNANMDTAHNGVEALKKVEIGEFDLILMDLQMPEMDGFTATKKIRGLRHGNLHEIPIIALTASVQLDSKHRVFEVGMDDFVTKPFNPEELFGKIKRHTLEK
ncbi:MAG: response regulator [Bacteroidota bacterium]